MTIMLGIDAGIQGAIAFLEIETRTLLNVVDMPTNQVEVNGKTRSRIDRAALYRHLSSARGAMAYVERPEARPMRTTNKQDGTTSLRQPGAAGMLAFGEGYGCILMGCTAADIALTEVRPGTWKKALVVRASKDDARRRAAELTPALADMFKRVKDDGRAEAFLLGLYGIRDMR